MATRKRVTPARKPRAARKLAAAPHTETRREAVRKQVALALQRAKDSSREVLLAGIGAVASARDAQDERRAAFGKRKANLIAAGRKLEPKLVKAIDGIKERVVEGSHVREAVDGVKTGVEEVRARVVALRERVAEVGQSGVKFGKTARRERVALGHKVDARLARVWSGLGVTTRADLEKINRKVDKLIELQRA